MTSPYDQDMDHGIPLEMLWTWIMLDLALLDINHRMLWTSISLELPLLYDNPMLPPLGDNLPDVTQMLLMVALAWTRTVLLLLVTIWMRIYCGLPPGLSMMLVWIWITLDLLLLDDNQMLLQLDLEWTRMTLLLVVDDWKLMYDGPSPGLNLLLTWTWLPLALLLLAANLMLLAL